MKETLQRKIIAEIKDRFDSYELNEVYDSFNNPQLWLKLNKDDIIHMAQLIKDFNGRCIIISAYQENNHHVLVYHFDIDGIMINVEIKTYDKKVDSITPILKSADWTEREFKELYGIEPINHPNPKRLFLDDSIAEGILNDYIPLSKAMSGISTSEMWEKIQKEHDGNN